MSSTEHVSPVQILRVALNFTARSLGILLSLSLIALVTHILYNIFLHPLSAYPGPKLWAATRIPWIRQSLKGNLVFKIPELHQQYGPIVRIAPNELSYATGQQAWKQIYGHRPGGEMPKDLNGAGLVISAARAPSIVNSDRENHARMRKLVSHAFSERALREQESYLKLYVDKLMSGLRKVATEGPQDMVKWFNWTTFDIIGDLAFGEPFGCLDKTSEDPWVSMIFNSIRIVPWMQALIYYRVVGFAKYFIPKRLVEARNRTTKSAIDKVERRLNKSEDRKDFWSFILSADEDKGMSKAELHSNSTVFIIGGSETTATLLSGATYCLLKNKEKYKKLCAEIRGRFQNESEITVQTASELKYMLAVFEEALRFYPPAPTSLPRVVPGQGEVIEGQWVPGGTTVGIHQFAAFRSPSNFHNPNSFIPERWLPNATSDPTSPFYNDNRSVMQPFSYGPRNCIGRNLAYAEMRLILSRLLYNFDLELAPASAGGGKEDWIRRQRAFLIWDKVPLMVELRGVGR